MANAMLDARQEADSYRRIEVITGKRRWRRWTAEEKARIVAESFEAAVNGRPPAERLATRQAEAIPKLAELKTFTKAHEDVSGKTTLACAIRYATSRWDALTRYTTDGRLDISNNAAERAIRLWLWAGRTTSSPAPTPAASAPPRCIPWFNRHGSTTSIRKPGCAMSSRGSPTIRSTRSRPCCLGTGKPAG